MAPPMSNVAVSDTVRPAVPLATRNVRAFAAFRPVHADVRLFHAWRP